MSHLAAATGTLVASVGVNTCHLRRSRTVDESDREAAVAAVGQGAAIRAETAMDEVRAEPAEVVSTPVAESSVSVDEAAEVDEIVVDDVTPVPTPIPDPPASVVLTSFLPLPPLSESMDSFHSARSSPSTASIRSISSVMSRRRMLGPHIMPLGLTAEEGEADDEGESSSSLD